MPTTRTATSSVSWRFTSPVTRIRSEVPPVTCALANVPMRATLVTRLIAPAAVPRPPKALLGPFETSIDSTAKDSRVCEPTSRAPSTNTSPVASTPRISGMSALAVPPSPAPSVMPGTVRSASSTENEAVFSSVSSEMTLTMRGVLTIGAVALGEDVCCSTCPVTTMRSL